MGHPFAPWLIGAFTPCTLIPEKPCSNRGNSSPILCWLLSRSVPISQRMSQEPAQSTGCATRGMSTMSPLASPPVFRSAGSSHSTMSDGAAGGPSCARLHALSRSDGSSPDRGGSSDATQTEGGSPSTAQLQGMAAGGLVRQVHYSSRNGHEKPCQASSSHHSCLRSMRSGSHLVREVKRECSQSFPRWLPDRSHLGSTCPAQIRPCQLLLESPRLTREVCPPRGGFTCHGMRAHMVLSAPGHHLISVWRTGGEPWYPPPSVTTTALLRKRASIPGASP